MKKRLHHLIKLCLPIIFPLLLIKSCYSPVVQEPHVSSNSFECRAIQHTLGETCVPLQPERIIALEPRITLDPLIALGIKPIGFASYDGEGEKRLFGVSFDEVQGIENVGDSSQPSIEKILKLKPNLILLTDYGNSNQMYELLSEIAPTVSVPHDSDIQFTDLNNKAFFKENLRYVAKVVSREAKAEEVINQYQKRVEELRRSLGSQLQQIEVSVIFSGDGYIETIAKSDIISHILRDIGLQHKAVSYGEWSISIETITEYDSDVLFIVNNAERPPSFYFQNPMFSSLSVVKNNQAYIVSQDVWRGFGISAANKILDDLFKYLPKGE